MIDIQMIPGFKNIMLGGEGLFVTIPPDQMISKMAQKISPGGGFGQSVSVAVEAEQQMRQQG